MEDPLNPTGTTTVELTHPEFLFLSAALYLADKELIARRLGLTDHGLRLMMATLDDKIRWRPTTPPT